MLVVTILSHRYNSHTGSGETKVESHASSETHPDPAALLLNTARLQPGSQPHQCVGGNTVRLATLVSAHCARPLQESLVRDETRISLPAISSLTRTTLGQLCVRPRTSRSRPAATEPGRKPRVSGGTASAAMQCPRPCHSLLMSLLWHHESAHINICTCSGRNMVSSVTLFCLSDFCFGTYYIPKTRGRHFWIQTL